MSAKNMAPSSFPDEAKLSRRASPLDLLELCLQGTYTYTVRKHSCVVPFFSGSFGGQASTTGTRDYILEAAIMTPRSCALGSKDPRPP